MTDFEKELSTERINADGLLVDENAIDFIKNSDVATATFSQPRFRTKIRKLAKAHPDECVIIKDNDSYTLAKFPVDYINLRAKNKCSEEVLEERRQRMKNMHRAKKENSTLNASK